MSAFSGSSDDTLAFHIRANTDMLKRDLDGSLAYIKRFSDEAQRSLAKISSMTPATRSSFAPAIATPQASSAMAVPQAQPQVIPYAQPTAQAAQAAGDLAQNNERVAVSTEKSATSARGLFRALLIAKVVTEGLKLAVDGIDLKEKLELKDLSGIERAKNAIREALVDLPVVGGAGDSLGKIVNATKDNGWVASVTGARTLGNLRDWWAHKRGVMTDDEQAAADKEQAEADKKVAVAQEKQKKLQAAQDRADAIVTQTTRAAARVGKSQTEIGVLSAQEKLDDFNKGLDPHRKMIGSEQDAQAGLKGAVVDAQAKDADAKIGKLRSGVAEVVAVAQSAWSAFTAKGAETMERQIAGDAELREARLRTAGDVDQAERVALDERHRRRINAAAEQGDYEKQIAIDVAAEEDKQLEATIAKRREGERERDNATVLAIEGDLARQSLVRAVAVDARSALMSNLIGGTSSDENERYLRDVNKQQLEALLAIKAKIGGPATFG